MEPHIKLGFEFASELSEQLITISTAILALTISFTRDIPGNIPDRARRSLRAAWIMFGVSIVFGIWHLMALTGNLVVEIAPTGIEKNARLAAAAQSLTFVAATTLSIVYALSRMRRSEERPRSENGESIPETIPNAGNQDEG